MRDFSEFELENGLRVIVHEDHSVAIAAMNLLYGVGSRDEVEDKTGFAHLFEHLMFGGSVNIPNYDQPLQKAGGQNNAFTTPDITNYYITLPSNNIETAFWLESDRMLGLAFNEKSLEVQRSVVIEEFKQRYLNQPYGDLWLHLRPLAYKVHPYKWPTIGKDISHIEDAEMADVKAFFECYYKPNNAILVVAGNISLDEIKKLSEKWFGPIEKGKSVIRDIPEEPLQKKERRDELERNVPLSMISKVFHMPGRSSENYYSIDLISDVLGRGKSSRLFEMLVKQGKVFNDISAYVLGSVDPGLLVVSGKVNKGVSIEEAEQSLNEEIQKLKENGVVEGELFKVKNQAESSLLFNKVDILSRAMSLAFGAFLGNPNLVNEETEIVNNITLDRSNKLARSVLDTENSGTLLYKSTLN